MLYWLAQVIEQHGGLALFRYLTARSLFAFATAFIVTMIIARPTINLLYRKGFRSIERSYGDINTASKTGTPLMGGILLLISGLGSALLWCDLSNPFVLTVAAASIYFAAFGAADDILKVRRRDSDRGLSRAGKYFSQIVFGVALGVLVVHPQWSPLPRGMGGEFYVPFLKHALYNFGWLYVLAIVIMVIYSANAVNFADGMDGLAIMPSFFVILVLAVFSYVLGNTVYSQYLLYRHIPGAGELSVYCAALGGAALSFLWFNAHPAEVFMGDTGSLFLGGTLGTMAILLKQEVIFVMAGGIFLAEIASTAVQEWIGFGLLKRRILARAPLHHTFAHRGMVESKIVLRFWIISAMLAALALATLKIR